MISPDDLPGHGNPTNGARSPAPVAHENSIEGLPLDPRRMLGQVLKRRWLIVACAVLGLGGGVWAAYNLAPRIFAVESLLAWDSAIARAEGQDPMRELRTMMDSVKTPAVLAEVRRRMSLGTTLDSLAQRIEVNTNERSNLIAVTTLAVTPQEALALGETTLAVFQEQRVEFEKRRREIASRALVTSQAEAKKELAELGAALEKFRKEEGITDVGLDLQQALGDSQRLAQARLAARADAIAEGARVDSLTNGLRHRSDSVVMTEKTVRPQSTKLADIESELAGLRGGGLTPDHPRVTMLEAQAKTLREQQDDWSGAVVTERSRGRNPDFDTLAARITDAKAAQDAALGRERALGQLYTEANANVERLRVIEGKGADLVRAFHAAQAHVGELEAKLLQASDAARVGVTGLSLLEAPTLPVQPRKSTRKLYAAGGLAAGIAFGLLLAVALALRGLRVHTVAELAFWGRGPVVFSSQWPRKGDGAEVERDLATWLRSAPGSTLVVGAGRAEMVMAQELARLANWPSAEEAPRAAPVRVWAELASGPGVRRAVREADRVLVLVGAGELSMLAAADLRMRLGVTGGLGFVLLLVSDELVHLPEACGDAQAFWFPRQDRPRLRVVA